jgi:predicted PurR-regulated permease PerM
MAEPRAFPRAPLVAFAVIATVLGVRALRPIADVALVGFAGLLLGSVLGIPIDALARHTRRGLAVVLTLLVVLGAIGGAIAIGAPVLTSQAAVLATRVPAASDRVGELWRHVERSAPVSQLPEEVTTSVKTHAASEVGNVLAQVFPLAWSAVGVAVAAFALLALGFFFAASPDEYRKAALVLVPPAERPTADETLRRIGTALRRWMGGMLVSMTVMGTLTAVGLLVAGIDGWAALGVLTFFATFVPYAGALASALPGLAVGLSQSPRHFAYAFAVYLVVHLVEGYVVEPMIMKRAVRIGPATLLLWALLMSSLFGAAGVVLATPILVCLEVATAHLWVERALGGEPEPIGAETPRPG